MIEVKKYTIDSGLKQVHMVGEYVGVWWQPAHHYGFLKEIPIYTEPKGPIIGFLNVHEDSNGKCWLDDESPIEINYITSDEAEQLAQELRLAIEYIKSL